VLGYINQNEIKNNMNCTNMPLGVVFKVSQFFPGMIKNGFKESVFGTLNGEEIC
jgi:hypothetical protein